MLAEVGVERGLIGPQEVPRLWERHLLNSAVVAELIDPASSVADVGSGAGLPGIPLAIARPDLRVTLIEPLLRRVKFLMEAVSSLALENVTVLRTRAEDLGASAAFDTVTARAVAPMERLVRWTLPLCKPGGQVLAIKGKSGADELAAAENALRRAGAASWELVSVGGDVVELPTRLIVVRKTDSRTGAKKASHEGK
jgi:16S rRNA (guanine527-N7)-methyltransferase